MRPLLRVVALASLLGAAGAHAQTLLLGALEYEQQVQQERPARGASMQQVSARFGPPALQRPPVGQPPISRWE